MVAIGSIVKAHGIRGELRLLPYNPSTTSVRPGVQVMLVGSERRREVTIAAVRPHRRFLLLTLEGVSSRDDAEAMVGDEVCVPLDALPRLDGGEVYYFQLVGLDVVTGGGERIGTVRHVFRTGASDVCVVADQDREVLLPLVADVVRSIDTAAGKLVIEPLPGLLDG